MSHVFSCARRLDWAVSRRRSTTAPTNLPESWTWGAFVDFNQKNWAFRTGYFLLSATSNANNFDTHIPDRGQYTAELELRYQLFSQPGKLRLFGWLNHGTMGGYSEALALPLTSPNYPDITLTRRTRTNYGLVANT